MSKAAKKPKNAVENDKLYKVPEVLQVISDHFGVVLGEEEPEPYITPEEEANARGVFAQYDKDRSGKIDKAEMKAMLKDLELELDSDAYEKYVEAAWASADLDDSGKIDVEEFLLFYARVYAPAFKYGARLRKAVGRDETRMAREYIQRGCDPTGAAARASPRCTARRSSARRPDEISPSAATCSTSTRRTARAGRRSCARPRAATCPAPPLLE